MSRIEEILSRALLTRDRTVPLDIIPASAPATTSDHRSPLPEGSPHPAAEDLRALCETLVTYTPATAVSEFVTDQLPGPRSALVLACVLQLTDTDDGARFWWQYAAGAGQAAAAYCLYLHHLALGETDAADWWHRQADDVQTAPGAPGQRDKRRGHQGDDQKGDYGDAPKPKPEASWHPANHMVTDSSTTTILRILRHLAKSTVRSHSAAVTELKAYVPTAVATGYLRQPEMDLPMPGPDFACRIGTLLASAPARPVVHQNLPARPASRTRRTEPTPPQLGERASR